MSIEIYLLSIPLARHRNIVPRIGRRGGLPASVDVRSPDHPLSGAAETRSEPSWNGAPIQHISPD